MKKSIFIAALAALILASCGGNKKAEQDSARIADLTQEYNEATSFNDSLMLLMGDIYTGLDSINQQEGLLYNMGSGDNVDRRAEIRQNLANIKARLEANRQLLADMEKKVANSSSENKVLNKTITQLKNHIAQQDEKIAQMQKDLDNYKGQVAELNTQVEQGKQDLAAANEATEVARQETAAAEEEANVANTVYYAIGTNKELKNNGLLEKKFLGSTKVLQGSINTSYLTKADKRQLTSIPTNGKKVKIWSNMPVSSYRIVGEKDGPKTIQITDPSSFWSRSNILVVQID